MYLIKWLVNEYISYKTYNTDRKKLSVFVLQFS